MEKSPKKTYKKLYKFEIGDCVYHQGSPRWPCIIVRRYQYDVNATNPYMGCANLQPYYDVFLLGKVCPNIHQSFLFKVT